MTYLDTLLREHHGILLARDHRSRKSSLSRWLRAGRLVRLLPGVYVHPGAADDLATRVRAVAARIPGAVIAGEAAARLTHWPQAVVTAIEVLVPGRRVPGPGFSFSRRRVPAEQLVRAGVVVMLSAPLVAVDSAATDRGDRIDDLLRAHVPLPRIAAALASCPHRTGNPGRRRILQRSSSRPWSQAERLLHDLLDRNRIRGWRANRRIRANGENYFPDVAFDEAPLILEVDGYEHHHGRAAFEADRTRANQLVRAGWTILRITWQMLVVDQAGVVTLVRSVLRRLVSGRDRPGGAYRQRAFTA